LNNQNPVKPLQKDQKPIFDEPWHAQVLAIADGLVLAGCFSANDWSNALGAARKTVESDADGDSVESYYKCALSALEALLAQNNALNEADISKRSAKWANAYLATPHGQPVKLSAG